MRELKRYKEEAIAIALLSVLLLLLRWLTAHYWSTPGIDGDEPAQYDLRSETETIAFVVLRLVIYTIAAWIGLRIIMPEGYTWLKHGLVDNFKSLPSQDKTTISTRMYAMLFFGLVLLALSGCNAASANVVRDCVVESYRGDIGVREATGNNDGTEVETYLAQVGQRKGAPWCAAFVSYHLSACGVANPKSAWSPAFVGVGQARVWTRRKSVRTPLPGDVFTLYYANLGRVGHTGFVDGVDGRYLLTVEGNTNGGGSRDGDGVYVRRRELNKVHAITNYIHDEAPATGAMRRNDAGKLQVQVAPRERHRTTRQHARAEGAARHAHLRAGRYRNASRPDSLSGYEVGDAHTGQGHSDRERDRRRADSLLCVRHRIHTRAALGYLDNPLHGANAHCNADGDQGSNPHMVLVAAGGPLRGCRLEAPLHVQSPQLTHGHQ